LAVTLAERMDTGMIRRIQQFTTQNIPVAIVSGLEPKSPEPKIFAPRPEAKFGGKQFGRGNDFSKRPGKPFAPRRDAGFAPRRDEGFAPRRDQGFPPRRDEAFAPRRDQVFVPRDAAARGPFDRKPAEQGAFAARNGGAGKPAPRPGGKPGFKPQRGFSR